MGNQSVVDFGDKVWFIVLNILVIIIHFLKFKFLIFYNINFPIKVWICPKCRKQDDGSPMIGCDKCDEWYHNLCLGLKTVPSGEWFCPKCVAKKSAKKKKVPRKKWRFSCFDYSHIPSPLPHVPLHLKHSRSCNTKQNNFKQNKALQYYIVNSFNPS